DFVQAQRVLRDASRRAKGLGLIENQARIALAYENATWRTERTADCPPEQLLAEALVEIPEHETALRIELLGARARALLYAGEMSEAREHLMTAIALARQFGEPYLLAVIVNYQFDFPWTPGETEELLALTTEVQEAAAATDQDILEIIATGRTRRLVFL